MPAAPSSAPTVLSPLASPTGRYPEVNVDALQEFEQVAAARGLNADSIFIPKQRGRERALQGSPRPRSSSQGRLQERAAWILALSFEGWWEVLAEGGALGPDGIPGSSESCFSFFHRSLLSRE